jgi:hypothetical protein
VKQLIVTIPIKSRWPTQEDLAARNAAMDAVSAEAIGTCTGAGGGMGEMDYSFRVTDETLARATIDRAMQEHMPGVVYHIRVGT